MSFESDDWLPRDMNLPSLEMHAIPVAFDVVDVVDANVASPAVAVPGPCRHYIFFCRRSPLYEPGQINAYVEMEKEHPIYRTEVRHMILGSRADNTDLLRRRVRDAMGECGIQRLREGRAWAKDTWRTRMPRYIMSVWVWLQNSACEIDVRRKYVRFWWTFLVKLQCLFALDDTTDVLLWNGCDVLKSGAPEAVPPLPVDWTVSRRKQFPLRWATYPAFTNATFN